MNGAFWYSTFSAALGGFCRRLKKVCNGVSEKNPSQKVGTIFWGSVWNPMIPSILCESRDFPVPRGPNDQKIKAPSKFSISIKIFNLVRNLQSRRLDLPTKNRAAVGGSLENVILARNLQSRSTSRFFLIFGPSGFRRLFVTCGVFTRYFFVAFSLAPAAGHSSQASPR